MNVILKLRRKQWICVLAFFIIGVTGCRPLSKIENNNIQTEILSNNNFSELNGMYSNSSDTSFSNINHFPGDGLSDYQRLTILGQLFQNYPKTAWNDENNQMINPEEKWIKIEFKSKKEATISMYHNDLFVFSKRIHGKLKHGYFYLRPKIYAIPLIPLIFGYNFERARLGKTLDDNLVLDYTVNKWGFALVSGSASKGVAKSIYKKAN